MAKKKKKAIKKAKAKKAAPKKKKTVAKKAKPAATKTKKAPAKTPSKKKATAKAKKPAPKKVAKKKQIVGEGDYAATRAFDKAQADFVKSRHSEIPALGKKAEEALDGPEGDSLREAEATAAARSRDTF